jgi:MFS family permease
VSQADAAQRTAVGQALPDAAKDIDGHLDRGVRLRAVMAVPSLRWAVLAWGLSVIAETASLVALLVVAYEVGGPALLAGFSILRAVPALIVAPVVIGWSDRGRRGARLATILATRAGLLALAAALLAAGASVAGLLAGGLASVLFSTHRPMSGALLPHLATSPAQLTAANAASSFAESAGTLVGPLLAGVLLVVGPPPLALALAAVVVGAAAVAVRRIHDVPGPSHAGSAITLAAAVREFGGGLRALIRQPPLVALVFVQTFARGVLLIAVVVLAVDTFGQGDPGVGWLTAMLGVGGLAGSAAAATLVTSTRISRAVPVGVALWGLPMVAIGALTIPAVGYIGLVIIGIGNAVLDVGAFTLVARVIPPTLLGRAFAAFEVILVLGVTTGSLVAGLAIPAFGVAPSLWLTGCVLLALAAGSIPWARRLDARLIPGDHASALRECRELDALPLAAVDHLATVGVERTFADGEDVMVQGADGDEFHVIMSGRARVSRDDTAVAELGPGTGFGEIALLRHVPRTATVTAVGRLTTFSISRLDFTIFVAGNPAAAAAVANVAQERALADERRGLG